MGHENDSELDKIGRREPDTSDEETKYGSDVPGTLLPDERPGHRSSPRVMRSFAQYLREDAPALAPDEMKQTVEKAAIASLVISNLTEGPGRRRTRRAQP